MYIYDLFYDNTCYDSTFDCEFVEADVLDCDFNHHCTMVVDHEWFDVTLDHIVDSRLAAVGYMDEHMIIESTWPYLRTLNEWLADVSLPSILYSNSTATTPNSQPLNTIVMRTIYRIWLSALKREGKFFFAKKEMAEAYAIKLVKHYGGFYKLIEYYDNGTIECEDE